MIIHTQNNDISSSEVEFISNNGEGWRAQNTPGFKVQTRYGLTSGSNIVTHHNNLIKLIPDFEPSNRISKFDGNNYKLTFKEK